MANLIVRPSSGSGTGWYNIANIYDTSDTSYAYTHITISNYLSRVLTLNFSAIDIPSNAVVTKATLSIRLSQNIGTVGHRITVQVDVNGNSNNRIINKELTSTGKTAVTGDITDYVMDGSLSSLNITAYMTSTSANTQFNIYYATIDVEYEIIQGEKIAEYKFNNTLYDLIPEFNNGFTYTVEDVVEGNVTTRTIYSDSLPTLMRFGTNTLYAKDYVKGSEVALISIEYLDTSNLTTCYNMFKRCTSLVSINTDGWNTSNVTTMQSMFAYCSHLTTLNIGQFNMTNVTNIRAMFDNCKQLTTIDVSNWDTSNVTDMYCTFYECNNLTSLNVSNWDVSNVTDMDGMFCYCYSLTTLGDISNWDTSNVKNMNSVFYACESLTELNVSGWDTSKVEDMQWMFGFYDYDDDTMSLMSITGLENWDTSNVNNMEGMFCHCRNLTTLDLSNWNTSNVTNMDYMFCDCTLLSNMIMNNSDYNSVNKIIAELPTRSSDSMGILNVTGIDDIGQVNMETANSKYWNIINKAQGKIVNITAGNNNVINQLINNRKIKNVYLGNNKLL